MSHRPVSSGFPHEISNNMLPQAGEELLSLPGTGKKKKKEKKNLKGRPPSAVGFRIANLCTGNRR